MAGTIQRKGDKLWIVRIFLGRDANGKTKHFNKTIHGSKKDAQEYMNAKLRERDLGTFITPTSMSVNKFLDRWLKECAKHKLSLRTFENTKGILDNHIRPKIGVKKLTDIQPYEIQKIYNGMTAAGLSPRTVRIAHNALSSALKQAVKWRMVFQNPCSQCELPKSDKKEMKYLSPEEVKRFIKEARGDRYYAAFLLAIETGMRPEEYLGLQWKDVDFDEAVLTIRRALIKVTGKGFHFAETKTKKSRRSIPLSENVIRALNEHRRVQLKERMKLGPNYDNHDLVFATKIGTPVQHSNFVRRHFKVIRDDAKLPAIRLYDLRHTTATLLLSAGENPKVVSERLGHASIVLTLDTYSHVLPTMQKDSTVKIEKLMFGT